MLTESEIKSYTVDIPNDIQAAQRASGCASANGYAVLGKRVRDGKEETFRTPRNPEQWYRHPVADKMLATMKAAHPSWEWQLQHEPHNVQDQPHGGKAK